MPRQKDETRADRVRKYRQRLREDPERYEEYLRKERERNQKRREEGKLKRIKDLSERQQRNVRKEWRKRQKRHREMLKRQDEMEVFLRASSPGIIEDVDAGELFIPHITFLISSINGLILHLTVKINLSVIRCS